MDKGSVAQQFGVLPGMFLIKVNGDEVLPNPSTGLSLDECMKRIQQGLEGLEVTLTLLPKVWFSSMRPTRPANI